MPSTPLYQRRSRITLTKRQILVLAFVMAAAMSSLPAWLGTELAHSAPASLTAPLPAATPALTLNVPNEVLIGEPLTFTVEFTNTGNAIGYGPFIDLVLDGGANLAKTGCPCDGITFVDAKMVGVNGGPVPLTSSSAVTMPCGNAPTTVPHPFATSGIHPVTVPAGAQLVTITLPFGSYNPSPQPKIVIEVTVNVSNLADVNVPLKISARSGFRYGSNALDDPSTDAPLLSDENPPGTQVTNSTLWNAQAQTTPTTMTIAKRYLGPENENATGPNFVGFYPLQYEITVNIANGLTLSKLKVQDLLPNNMQYQGVTLVVIGSTTGSQVIACSAGANYQITQQPPTTAPQNPTTNLLEVSFCNPITGTTNAKDVTVRFAFFIPSVDANGASVLPPNCTPAISQDNIRAEADWVPLDACDIPAVPPVHVVSDLKPVDHRLSDKCIAIQKEVTLVTDLGATGPTPGDVLRYRIKFQVSSFKTAGSIQIRDTLSDGQQLLLNPAPTFRVSDKFAPTGFSGTIVPGPALTMQSGSTPACGVPETGLVNTGTNLTFRISTRMGMLPLSAPPRYLAGILTGGLAGLPTSNIPATGEVVFFARIEDQFFFPHPPGDILVDKDDPINNCVVIRAIMHANSNAPAIPPPTAFAAQDDSGTALKIVSDTIEKKVYAVRRPNILGMFSPVCGPGSAGPCSNSPSAPQEVRPGDQVTYRLTKIIPSGDAENLTIRDFHPLPVLDVRDPDADGTIGPAWQIANSVCSIPAPGNACLLASNTLAVTAGLTQNNPTNSLIFNYGTFNSTANQPLTIDVIYTGTVTTRPFADGLFLTNQAQECETNTFGITFCQSAIAQIKVRQPNLRIRKGIIAANNVNALFSQPASPQTTPNPTAAAPAGATLSLSGISGVVHSTNLAAGLLDSNISNVDANDILTFAITIENVGGAPAYDSSLDEIIPTFMGNPVFTIISPITVKRGTGANVLPALYSITSSAGGFNISSLTPFGFIPQYHPTNGSNIVVITFQGQLRSDLTSDCWKNRIKLLKYASKPGGQDFVSAGFTQPFEDIAEFCMRPTLNKSVVATSEAHTTPQTSPPGTPPVVIGEIVRYHLDVVIPEGGTLANLQLSDTLSGMKFLNDGTARLAFISNKTPAPGITHSLGAALDRVGNAPLSGAALNVPPVPGGVVSGGATCGSLLNFNLGNVQNTDNDGDLEYVSLEFNAVVCNQSTNQSGTTLTDVFTMSAGGLIIAASNTIAVNVVEPNLTIGKTVSPATVTQGATVTYTVTITNTGPVDAFDVIFGDTLPAGLTFVPSSVTVAGACLPSAAISGTSPAVKCPRVPANGTVTITYKAVANPLTCPAKVTNKATVTWTSLPGLNGTTVNPTMSVTPGSSGAFDGERNGVSPALNDYTATASAPLGVNCPPCVAPPQSMSAWWPFDEPNGATTLRDIAAVNNQGTPKPGSSLGSANAPSAIPGRVSGAVNFNSNLQSTGPHVEVPDHPEVNFGTGDFSIDSWVFVPQPPTVYIHPIVDKLQINSAGTQGTGYALYLVSSFTGAARFQLIMGDGGPLVAFGPNLPSMPLNAWTHIAVTVKRSTGTSPGTVTFYVNGNPVPPASAPMPAGSLTNTLPLLIGESRSLGVGQGAISLDELEMFTRVLQQSEIQGIVNAGAAGKCKCLVAGNQKIGCNSNGSFTYTFTLTNLSAFTATGVTFSAGTGITITPNSMTIPPLASGGSTTVTVTISGPAAVSGANVCLFVGLTSARNVGCRVSHCITLPACQSTGCAKQPPNMISWWPLNETSGTTVVDIKGGHNGTTAANIGADPSSASSPKVGNALFFGSSRATVSSAPYNFGTGNFSIDAWVRGTPLTNASNGIVDKLDTSSSPATGFAFRVRTGFVQFIMGDGVTSTTFNSAGAFNYSNWQHVAVTVQRTGTGSPVGRFYINGAPAGTFVPMPGNINNNVPLLLGSHRLNANCQSCEVALDEIEIFSDVLSAGDVNAIYQAGPNGKCTNGSLTVNKIITSAPPLLPPATAVFPVGVTCQPSGYNQTINLTAASPSQTFSNIPIGDTCTVIEGPLPAPISNPVCPALGWSPPTYIPGQTVTIPTGPTPPTVTITNQYRCTTSCAKPPPSMVAWWPMKITSNTVNDLTIFNNFGIAQTYQPVSGMVQGVLAGALYFNNNPAFTVSVPNHGDLSFPAGDVSIDAWIRIAPGGPADIQPILDKLNLPSGPGFAFYVRNQRLELNLNGTTYVSTAPAMLPANPMGNSGPWYHVAVTVGRSQGQINFYLNGSQAGTYNATVNSVTSGLPLWIGETRVPGTRREIALDELELFNSVISQAQIQRIFNAGANGKCP